MISINDDRFLAVDTLIDIDKDMEINLSLVEKITAPYNLSVDFSYRDTDKKTDVLFRWNQDLGWSDSFEEYDDFATQFGGWATFDKDRLRPYGITINNTHISIPGLEQGESPVMVFNPEKTTPRCDSDAFLNTVLHHVFWSPKQPVGRLARFSETENQQGVCGSFLCACLSEYGYGLSRNH